MNGDAGRINGHVLRSRRRNRFGDHCKTKNHKLEEEKNEMFSSYKKFVKKIIAVFESVNLKKEVKHKLEHLKQKESASNYAAEFRQIATVLDWNDKVYVSLFYWELKNEVKNELAKIEWLNDLDEMIKIVVWIDNHLGEKQQEKKKNSWKKQHEHNKNKKKNHEQLIN